MTKATDLDTLADDLLITEERTTQIALDHRLKTVDHTLTLRRDSASIADFKAMLGYLQAAGAPDVATIQVRTEVGERWKDIRVTAHWSTEPTEASR